jgi:aminoglycoside phosphotransferase (APT) family kinase protein
MLTGMTGPGGTPPRLTAAGVSECETASVRQFTGGTFNAVYEVRRTDGRSLVVKLAPDPAVPVLRYEHGILATEALYYHLAGQRPGVAVPAVLAASSGDGATGGYLVMTQLPGTPWSELAPEPAGPERDELRAELGRQVALLHAMTGTGFGYPAESTGQLRPTWRAAFADMVGAVLADASRFGVTLPLPAARVRALFEAQAPALDEVTTPVLVHFDLWDGNILVVSSPRGRQIGGLIDAERAFWGDPLADFVSLGLFGDITADRAFLHGYRSAGGAACTGTAPRRLALYRAYLYLIMWVEAAPRQYRGARLARLRRLVYGPLAATFASWSRSGW